MSAKAKAVLVRIGVDHSYGAWNAPVNPNTGQFVFVPIPDGAKKAYTPGNVRTYSEMDGPLKEFEAACKISALRRPDALSGNMHLDPDFDHPTYGDNGKRRGAGIAKLQSNDLAEELIRVYNNKRRNAPKSALAKRYCDALPWLPPKVDEERKRTYSQMLSEAGGSRLRSACGGRKRARCGRSPSSDQ